jgi:uncharacterized protein (DUF983 family)
MKDVISVEKRNTYTAIKRGVLSRCPRCGQGKLFRAFLKPVDNCSICGEDFTHHRADDLPAYLSVIIVGHVAVAGFMATDQSVSWPSWVHLAIWTPVTLVLALATIQPIKGAVIGFQSASRMHGFGDG